VNSPFDFPLHFLILLFVTGASRLSHQRFICRNLIFHHAIVGLHTQVKGGKTWSWDWINNSFNILWTFTGTEASRGEWKSTAIKLEGTSHAKRKVLDFDWKWCSVRFWNYPSCSKFMLQRFWIAKNVLKDIDFFRFITFVTIRTKRRRTWTKNRFALKIPKE
jgi:hypothetical protein